MTAWFKRLFAPRVTVRSTTTRPMKPDEIEAFNRAFSKMDEAFAELDKVFKP